MALKSHGLLISTFPDKGTLPSAVVGLALLNSLLYVVCKKSPNVFVFDTEDQRRVSVCHVFLMTVESTCSCMCVGWLGGVVVRSQTSDSEVPGSSPTGTLSSNNLEQVIYTRDAQANSAFHPSGAGK